MLLFLILILITFFLLCQTLDVNLKNWIRRPELLSNDNYQDVVDYLVERNYSSDIPRYGFFSSIIESLVKIRKTYGVDIKKALRELRKAILKDYKQKRKLRSELFGLYLQYMMLLIFTWGFLFQLLGTIKINVTSSQILLLIFQKMDGLVILSDLINIFLILFLERLRKVKILFVLQIMAFQHILTVME